MTDSRLTTGTTTTGNLLDEARRAINAFATPTAGRPHFSGGICETEGCTTSGFAGYDGHEYWATAADWAADHHPDGTLCRQLRPCGQVDCPNRPAVLRITGHDAAEIARHTAVYVRPTSTWSEVEVMRQCNHGCKLYARKRGAITQYRLIHSSTYGCPLARHEATRELRVSIAPKAGA